MHDVAPCRTPPKTSGTILQKALGNNPLLMFFMALCTSSFDAETPLELYLDSVTIQLILRPQN